MRSIATLKQQVKELVEGISGVTAFYDICPNNIKTGILIARDVTEFTGRVIDGDAHIAHHGFDVTVFSFENADVCDDITVTLVNATDGKYSQDFRLIMVNSITPSDYDPDSGFWANVISMEFVER